MAQLVPIVYIDLFDWLIDVMSLMTFFHFCGSYDCLRLRAHRRLPRLKSLHHAWIVSNR
jgi:hypothetical protein